MKYEYSEMYEQLLSLQKEYPNIITKVAKSAKFNYLGYASAVIIGKDIVCISYNRYGFYVSMSDGYFNNKYFPTASEALDELAVWMHKYGYRFKKFDTPKVRNGNCYSSVTQEPVAQ